MQRITAIVVTYHPEESAFESLRLLAKQTDHVIVVDNSATPEDQARLTDAFGASPESFTLLLNATNLGIAAALNRGICHALERGAEWALTMDQDSRVTDGMVAAMSAIYDALPDAYRSHVASLAPHLLSAGQPDEASPGSTPLPYREVDAAITSGNLVNLAAWAAIGGYEEKLFIDYVDHDFCSRLRRAGWVILECPTAHLLHKIGNAGHFRFLGWQIAIDQHPPLRTYYITRNGFYFWRTFPESRDFIRSDKINTLRLFIKAFLLDTHKLKRLRMFWRGYHDFRRGHFGCYKDHWPS